MASPGMLGLGPIAHHGASVSTTAWAGELERGSSRAGVPHSHPDLCLLLWPLQMNQIPVGGQPSSSLQDASQLYSPASQTQLPLPPGTQQVLGAWGGALDSETRIPALGWAGTSLSLSLLPGNMEIAFPMPLSWSHSWGSLKPLQGTETDYLLGPWTSHLAKQHLLKSEAGVGWGSCEWLMLSLTFFLSLWEVPSRGPVWLPIRSTDSLPPAPHGHLLISGTSSQTLSQAHLLIQVRSRAGQGRGAQGGERRRLPLGQLRLARGELLGSGEPPGGTCSRKDCHGLSQPSGWKTHSRP